MSWSRRSHLSSFIQSQNHFISNSTGHTFDEIVGDPSYMAAPEMLRRIFYRFFWAETEQGVVAQKDACPKFSDREKNLGKKMLNPDPKQSLTAKEVLDHTWLQNAKSAPNVSLGEIARAKLNQFSMMNKLKKRALRVIAEHFTVVERFQFMDIGNKGKIDINELRAGLHKLDHQIPESDLLVLMEADYGNHF